ncbi:hypothetical protein [Nostoc sp. LPT]|uniref:hypothetical protein n=1 Tax=Nostoc sp. LPT TaxID=2815387 RepID=UPI001D8088FA|nr:hypothetical protein [Nostoc sp. LPT]MBN4005046.1 hypothetical protein [Nostoc sp. LPT]
MQFIKQLGKQLGFVVLISSGVFSPSSAMAGESFEWNQDFDRNPKPMINARKGVCFLKTIQGKFEGGREKIEINIKNGQWFLNGDSDQSGGGVRGEAYCVQWTDLVGASGAVFGPYNLSQNDDETEASINLNGFNEGDGVCFLGSISGKFRGGAEKVQVTLDPYSREWILKINSKQIGGGVSASAYCIPTAYNYTKLTNETTLLQPLDKGESTVDLGSNYAACFLIGIAGKFQGGKENVNVYDNFGEWFLKVSSDQFGVSGSTRCYRK